MSKLIEAITEIAYDNGAVNRFRTEKEVVDGAMAAVIDAYSPADLWTVECYLTRLSKEELEELCCGEHKEPTTEEEILVDNVLNHVFENI